MKATIIYSNNINIHCLQEICEGTIELKTKSLEFTLVVAFDIPIDAMEKVANIMTQYVAFHTLNFKISQKFTYTYLFLPLNLHK